MNKKLLMPMISFIIALAITCILATRIAHAQCGCSCAMVCDNTCEYECYGCGFGEAVTAALHCCEEARRQTGPTGPCTLQ